MKSVIFGQKSPKWSLAVFLTTFAKIWFFKIITVISLSQSKSLKNCFFEKVKNNSFFEPWFLNLFLTRVNFSKHEDFLNQNFYIFELQFFAPKSMHSEFFGIFRIFAENGTEWIRAQKVYFYNFIEKNDVFAIFSNALIYMNFYSRKFQILRFFVKT